MTPSQFAKHINVKPGYVTQLKAAGRLVMQGELIDSEASKLLIEETKDPSKAGVAERHANERQQKQGAPDQEALTIDPGSNYQKSRAMKEKYNALQAQIAYEKEVGLLLVASDAKAAVADGDTIIRNRLESLPDMLAPQLAAESDEQKIRALLMDQVEFMLSELSRSFHELAK